MLESIKTSMMATIMAGSAIIAQAQKKITEGIMVYSAEYKTEVPNAPKEQKVKFNSDISRLDMEVGPATIAVFFDNKSQTGLILVDVPVAQKQIAAKMTKADIDDMNASKPKFSNFKATGEKQSIAGYNAEKYTFKDDKNATYELWATTEIEVPLNIITKEFKEVKGTVIKFTNDKATGTLKSLTEDKVGALSLSIPSEYEEITYAELKALQSGGGN